MRIVIDMQGAQTESRFRGIGRYTLSLAQAIVRNRGEHEIILALSGLFPETIESIRAAFDGLLPQENIRVWHALGPVHEREPGNEWRREVAERIREAFLASLWPDVVYVSSLFEGYIDDAVTSIGVFAPQIPTVVTLYDLIPLLNPETYLKPNSDYAQYYQRKIEHLRRANSWLAISESAANEGREALALPFDAVVNISTACDAVFHHLDISEAERQQLQTRFGITKPFILYSGGADERKNLHRSIRAYAQLPKSLQVAHQLVLAGRMPEGEVAELRQTAKSAGIGVGQVLFTGYVTNEDLARFYNLCTVFIFPSLHEGFGLPALEAMSCGTAVIGANTTSVPEVIGRQDAMFDPYDEAAIRQKLAQVLGDEAFRSELAAHGLEQAKKFSWDESAKRAIAAFESLHGSLKRSITYINCSLSGDRLIQALAQCITDPESAALTKIAVCIAQNKNAGIARQLMLDVSELSQRDAATGVQRVVRSYLKALLQSPPAGFRVEPIYATQDEGYRYARRFTQRFLGQDTEHLTDDPVQWQRGDVFFGLDMQHHVQLAHAAFYQQLRLDGVTVKFLVYDLLPIQLAGLFKDSNLKELHEQLLKIIAAADGAICISNATADAYKNWIAENAIRQSSNFQVAWVHIGADIDGSKPSQGLPTDALAVLNTIRSRPSFLCVATLEPRKGQQQIVEALQLLWNDGLDVNLVLVGQQGWKIEALAEAIRNHPEKDQRLFWLQGISDEYLEHVYRASTCLINASINEGFGLPLIEAARHGIPIVARDIPVFREVAGDCAFYFIGETPRDLATALKAWFGLHQEGRHPKSEQMRWSTWEESAERLKAALIQENYPRWQLLVDVSELVQRDARSGIQRVVRSVLKQWLNHSPAGYRVEPVYATVDRGYRYARRFTQGFLNCPDEGLQDETMEYAPGDVFFGLDLQPQVVPAQRAFYQVLRGQGVQVQFLVHDLLCIQMPQYFLPGSAEGFTRWLEVVAESDGAVCVSKTVADELADWVKENGPVRQRPFRINWYHNGADIDNSTPTKGLPADADTVLSHLRSRSSFLMVGTLEPRKGHAQVLEAFEQLWQTSGNVNLVIVGKQGWLVESLVDRLRTHHELNKRLFWLEGISDEYLEEIYAASTCLIAASEGEGFGLPLIEAAQHGLPIIARDIPVFREVSGEHTYYFSGRAAKDMANAISSWLVLFQKGEHPKSEGLHFLTWRESALQLIEQLNLNETILGRVC